MNIESATFNDTADHKGRSVTLKYSLSNPTAGDTPYRLLVNAVDCTATADGSLADCNNAQFGNLKAYLAYQNMVGRPTTTTEFSAYNNGGNVAFACLYEGPPTTACPTTAVNDGGNHYTATIPAARRHGDDDRLRHRDGRHAPGRSRSSSCGPTGRGRTGRRSCRRCASTRRCSTRRRNWR